MVKELPRRVPAFPSLMSSCITKITHLCGTYDSARSLHDQNYLVFVRMLSAGSLRPSCGAKNGDRLWQTFHTPLAFFLGRNSKRKQASRSSKLSGLTLCTHNATHFRILQASTFLWMCTKPKNLRLVQLHITTIAFRWIYPALEEQKILA